MPNYFFCKVNTETALRKAGQKPFALFSLSSDAHRHGNVDWKSCLLQNLERYGKTTDPYSKPQICDFERPRVKDHFEQAQDCFLDFIN
jgi:hypothetical protein